MLQSSQWLNDLKQATKKIDMQPITIGLSPKVQENETFDRIASNSTIIRLIVGESKENIKENISEIYRIEQD